MVRIEQRTSLPANLGVSHWEGWLNKVADSFGYRMGELQVVMVSDDELLEVNRTHLNHDYYTDIISFDYTRGSRLRGELWISMDRVTENAAEAGVTLQEELDRVVVHGVLHFLGFRDKSPEEQAEMRSQENKCLSLRAN